MKKRALAFLLSVTMLISTLPLNALAEEVSEGQGAQETAVAAAPQEQQKESKEKAAEPSAPASKDEGSAAAPSQEAAPQEEAEAKKAEEADKVVEAKVEPEAKDTAKVEATAKPLPEADQKLRLGKTVEGKLTKKAPQITFRLTVKEKAKLQLIASGAVAVSLVHEQDGTKIEYKSTQTEEGVWEDLDKIFDSAVGSWYITVTALAADAKGKTPFSLTIDRYVAPATEEPAPSEEPTEPIADEPTTDEPATDEPAAEEPAIDEPAIDEPAVDEPTVDEPVADEPATDEPAIEEPAIDEPAADEPAAEEPAFDEPATDEPAADEPAAEEPAFDEPAIDEPAIDEPVADEPASDEPAADEAVADEPAADEAVADEPAADEPADDEPAAVEADAEPAPEAEPAPAADYAMADAVVTLADVLAARQIQLTQNKYALSVDSDLLALSAKSFNTKNTKLDQVTLTAKAAFACVTLTIRSNNGKDVHTITLSYAASVIEPEDDPQETEGMVIDPSDFMELSGKLPKHAIVDIEPVTVEIEGQRTLAAFDIKIYINENQKSKGKTWQPADKKVTVRWKDEAFAARTLDVFHVPADAAPEKVATVKADKDGWVEFDADGFSVYAVTEVIEKDIEIEGKTYRVTLAYQADAQIPDGAALDVQPRDDMSVAEAAALLGYGEEDLVYYARLLDISILYEGQEIEPAPGSEVTVTVKLLDAEAGAPIDVFHLTSAMTAEKIDSTAAADGSVTFTTDSFSLFGFSSAAKALESWTTSLLEGTFFGKSDDLHPQYGKVDVAAQGIERGLTLLDAFSVTRSADLWLRIKSLAELALGDLENISLYTVENGSLKDLVREGLHYSDILDLSLADFGALALVRDSGLRERALSAGGLVTLSGLVPKAATLSAEPVASTLDLPAGESVVSSYNISILNGETTWQPSEPVQVSLTCAEAAQALSDGYGVELWHVADDGSATKVPFTLSGDTLTFSATGFSEYTVVKTILEKTISTPDGLDYKITVSYDSTSGLPEGVDLDVRVLDNPDAYLEAAQTVLETEKASIIKAFDIAIVDEEGTHWQPNDNVTVTIELAGAELNNPRIVHIPDEGDAEGIVPAVSGELISFQSNSFSVYLVAEVVLEDTITAGDGNTYNITVKYDSTSGLPTKEEGAHLSVSEILTEEDLADVTAAIDSERAENRKVAVSRTFDIKILDKDDNEVQPNAGAQVQVTFELVQVGNQNLTTDVYHIKDEAEGYVAESLTVTNVEGNTATVTTDGFSLYTVEFTYEGKQYVLDGGNVVRLDEVLNAIGITGNIEDVDISDWSLFEVNHALDGNWYVYALNPFDTTEWMKVTIDGVVYEITVTDAFYGTTGSANAAAFANNADIVTIAIADLVNYPGRTVTQTGLTGDNQVRMLVNMQAGDTLTLGDANVTITYPGAATTSDGQTCDVIIKFSNITLYGDSRYSIWGELVIADIENTHVPNVTGRGDYIYSNGVLERYGVKEDITVSVCPTGTTTPVNGTFMLTIYDLNVNRINNSSQYIVNAASNHDFTERITVDGSQYEVYYNTSKLTRSGNDIYPFGNNGGGNSYETGVVIVANGSATFTAYQAGGINMATNFAVMPRGGINHPITSYSSYGGSIETTTTGTIGTGTVLPGGTVGDERVYVVPTGKHVEYLMTPASGYRMKYIKIDGTVVAQIDDSTATYTNTDTTNCVDNGDGTWTYTFPAVGDTHSIVVQWEPERDPELSLGHIGMQPGTNGAVTHVSLESYVPSGHPTTTTLQKDGTPRVMGALTSPPTIAGYTWFTFALGYTDDATGELTLYAKSDRLAMRFTANGEYEYSVNYDASSASNTWEVWNVRDSQGDPTVPKVYAVYVQDPSSDKGILYTTATAIARNTTDDAFVDPQMPITFNEVIERRYYTITVDNPTASNWSYTVTQRSTEPVETLSNNTHTHVPGEAHGHALSFATPQETIAAGNTTSFTFDDVYADNMLVTETVPANYTLTNILKLHGARGTEDVSTGTYRIYANTTNADADDLSKQFTVTRSVDPATGAYIFQVSAYNKAQDTEVEFINTRNTVDLTIRELLDDARLAANAPHDFKVTLRGRETWTDGRVHNSMLGTITVTAPNGDLTTGGSQTVSVPANADILIIQRFGDTFTSGSVTVKVTEYDTEATSSNAIVIDYRPLDKEYMITPGLTADATVTLKNVLKPRLVTVKKVLVGGDLNQSFSFTATLTQKDGTTPIANYLVYTDDSGLERTTNASGLVRFTLRGAGSLDLKVPYGASITINELKAAADTYTTVYSIDNEGTPHDGTEAVIGGDPTLGITKNHEVVFTNTSDFSVFDDANTMTYEFYLDENFIQAYDFPLVSTSDIIYYTNRLTVRNGGTLDVPPQPASPNDDLVFQGWFKNTADVGDPENWEQETGFGKIMTVTDAMNGTTVKVYAKFAATVYATFHENKITEAGNTFWPIQQTVPMAKGDTLNLNNYEPVVPDTHREFIGWTDTLNQDGTLGTIITTNYDAYQVNGNVDFYPIYNEKRVVSFLTGASGTGATYYAPVGVNMGAEVYSAVQAILDDDKIDNKIPRLAGYTFEGWYLSYDQTTDTYDQPVALSTGNNSYYSRGADASTPVNADLTLYAKWTPAPDAKFSVVIWTQDVSDKVGTPASEKNYNVRSVHNFNGTTDTQVTISGASGLQITYTGTSGTPTTETISGAPGTGFEFVRADTAYIAADGSTVLNVYYDRQVYTLIVRKGYQYELDNGGIASAGYDYTRTTTPDTAQTHYVGDGKTEVTYRMYAWKESDGTLHLVNGANDPRVFSAYRTLRLVPVLTQWSIYDNNSVADGSRGWILDTAGLLANAYIQSSTPVTAVYAWQDASGNVYDPATSEFYARREKGHGGDILDTYVGLYQAPLIVKSYNGYSLYYMYRSNGTSKFCYYHCKASDRTFVRHSYDYWRYSSYEDAAQNYQLANNFTEQGRPTSIVPPASYDFSSMLAINGMMYYEPALITGTNPQIYGNSSYPNLTYAYVLDNTNNDTIKYNLTDEGKTLTMFAGAYSGATEHLIYSYYYTLPTPKKGDALISDYSSYIQSYQGEIVAGNVDALISFNDIYNAGRLSVINDAVSGQILSYYYSKNYRDAWNDVVLGFGGESGRTIFYYYNAVNETDDTNRFAYWIKEGNRYYATGNAEDPTRVRFLFLPRDRTITFHSYGSIAAPVAGTLTVPNAWSLSAFDPNASADNPLKTYNSTLSLTKGTTLAEAASQYNWAASYLSTVGANSSEANMTFQGWYYDTAFTQEFHVTDTIEQETTLYAQWDYPWYVVQIDPNGGVLTGGSNNGSTWTWKQPTDTVDPYDSFLKREFVESDTGDYYYHINVYDKTNTAYSDDVGGLYDYDRDAAAGINAIARTAIYDTTSPGSDGKRYTYQPGVWKLDSWDYMWYDTANNCWPSEWQHDYVFSTRITNHLKLRAVWKRVATYKVVFDAAEGTVVTNTGTSLAGLYSDGDYYVDGAPMTIHVAAEPTDSKRQFVGWKSSVRANSNIYPLGTTYVVSDLDAVGDTITLVAQYSRMDLTSLRYDANGGEGKLTDVTAAAGTNQIWDGNNNTLLNIERNSRVDISGGAGFTYPKAGYTLVGWSKDDDASDEAFEETSSGVWAVKASNKGKGYFALGQQNAVIDGATGNELFAVWQPPTNVTFDPNGGSGTLETELSALTYPLANHPGSYFDSDEPNSIMNLTLNAAVTLTSGAAFLDPNGKASTDPDYRPIIGWNTDKDAADRGDVEYAVGDSFTVTKKGTNTLYAVWRPEKAIVNVHFANKDGRGYRDMDSVWQGDLLTIEVTKDYATSAFALSNSLAEDLDDDPLNLHGHNNGTHAQLLSSGIIVYASEIKPGETASDLASASAVTGLYYNPTDGKAYSSYSGGSYSNEVTDVWFVYRPTDLTIPTHNIEVVSGGYKEYNSTEGSLSVPHDGVSVTVPANPAGYSDVTAAVGSAASFGPLPNSTSATGLPVSLYGMSDNLWVRVVLNAAGTDKAIQYSPDNGTSWNDYTASDDPAVYLVYYKEGNVYITVTAEMNGGAADPENVLVDPNQTITFTYTKYTDTYTGTVARSERNQYSSYPRNYYYDWTVNQPSNTPTNSTAVSGENNEEFSLKPGESKVFVLTNTTTTQTIGANNNYAMSAQSITATAQRIQITQMTLANYTLNVTDDNANYGEFTGSTNTWEISSAKSAPQFTGYDQRTESSSSTGARTQSITLQFGTAQTQDDTTATFTNTREVVQVNFSKTLTDALATGPKPFGFTIDASQDWTNGNTATLNKLTGNVSVSNGGTGAFYIAIPKGADLTIVETGDTSEYETTATTTAGAFDSATKTVTATGVTANITVAYTNSRKYTLTYAGIWNGTNAYSVTQQHSFSGANYTTVPTTSFGLINLADTTTYPNAVPTSYEFLGWAKTQAAADAGTPDYDTTHLASKVFIDNDGSTDDLLPSGATSGDVVLYAVYKRSIVTLTVAKTVGGAMGDTTKEFTFTLAGLTAGTQVSWTKQEKTTASGAYSNLSTGATGTATADNSGCITFELKHWQKIELTVPSGANLTLTETAVTGYQTWMKQDTTAYETTSKPTGTTQTATITLSPIAADTTVQVLNWMDAVAPTGVRMGVAPFLLMLALGAGLCLMRPRRKEEAN